MDTYGPQAWRDLYRATFDVTRGLRFRCLIGRTAHLIVPLYNKQRTLRAYSYPGFLRDLDLCNI